MDWPISIKIVISANSFPVISLVLGVLSIFIGVLIDKYELTSLGIILILLAVIFVLIAVIFER